MRAWPFVPAGREVTVAVLDSGIDWEHPDLGGPVPPAGVLWTNQAEIDGLPGVDDDGNTKVDDVIGWDFVNAVELSGIGVDPREDGADPDNDPRDFAGHGTHVAGLVTAAGDNGIGLAGHVGGVVRLMPVRVGWDPGLGGAVVYMGYCAQGLEYAALNGAAVANCSWDSADLFGLGAALDFAINDHDMVIVGSAGNSGLQNPQFEYLARRPDCLGVAGIRRDGRRAGFSNFGDWVALAAFGQGMPSTGFDQTTGEHTYFVSGPGGTSFASPQVAGAAAVLRAVAPEADAATIRETLIGTARDLSDVDSVYASLLGGGLLDLAAAVEALGGGWDAVGEVRGLTPLPGSGFALIDGAGGRILDAVGAPPETLASSAPPSGGLLPAAGRFGEDAVWVTGESDSLMARRADGGPLPGWSRPLPAGSASVTLADLDGDGDDEVLVPGGDSVRVFRADGSEATPLPLHAGHLLVGDFDPGRPGPEVAAVGAAGTLRLVDARGVAMPSWNAAVGEISVPPVGAELDGAGTASVILAGPDPARPQTAVRVTVLREGTVRPGFPVSFEAPPITGLSVAGSAAAGRLEIVVVDSLGGIHLVAPDGTVRFLDAGAPVAGEVLSADLDGDADADYLVLRRDGVLAAWNRALEPVVGFPRIFPFGGAQTPLLRDGGGQRYVVLADTAAGVWSIPVGPAATPAPWPTARGDGARTGYLDFERATPTAPRARLSWSWTRHEGRLCWSLSGDAAFLAYRAGVRGSGTWTTGGTEDDPGTACMTMAASPGDRVDLEGLGRDGTWRSLGSLVVPGRGLLSLLPPYPNPSNDVSRFAVHVGSAPARLEFFDVRGRRVRRVTVLPETVSVRWDGRDEAGRRVAAGLYFARLTRAGTSVVQRVLRSR